MFGEEEKDREGLWARVDIGGWRGGEGRDRTLYSSQLSYNQY